MGGRGGVTGIVCVCVEGEAGEGGRGGRGRGGELSVGSGKHEMSSTRDFENAGELSSGFVSAASAVNVSSLHCDGEAWI